MSASTFSSVEIRQALRFAADALDENERLAQELKRSLVERSDALRRLDEVRDTQRDMDARLSETIKDRNTAVAKWSQKAAQIEGLQKEIGDLRRQLEKRGQDQASMADFLRSTVADRASFLEQRDMALRQIEIRNERIVGLEWEIRLLKAEIERLSSMCPPSLALPGTEWVDVASEVPKYGGSYTTQCSDGTCSVYIYVPGDESKATPWNHLLSDGRPTVKLWHKTPYYVIRRLREEIERLKAENDRLFLENDLAMAENEQLRESSAASHCCMTEEVAKILRDAGAQWIRLEDEAPKHEDRYAVRYSDGTEGIYDFKPWHVDGFTSWNTDLKSVGRTVESWLKTRAYVIKELQEQIENLQRELAILNQGYENE